MAAAFGWLAVVEEVKAQTNYYWTNLVSGNWNVPGNWTNEVAGNAAPGVGGNVNYSIFVQTNLGHLVMTVDNSLLSDNKFTLNRLVINSTGTAGTNYITNSTATGTYLVFSTNSSGGLPQIYQNSNTITRFGIGIMLTNDLTVGGSAFGTGAIYFDKELVGTNRLTKAADFTLYLKGTNNFSGAVTIQAGGIQLDNTNSLRYASAIDVWSGGTLLLNAGGVYTNAITIAGVGASSLGAIRIVNAGVRLTGPITMNGDSRIGVYRTSSTTATNAGVIGGTGNLTFIGRGSSIAQQHLLILEATNTYAGTTTISSVSYGETFTVRLAGSNLLPTGTVLVMNNTTTNAARFDLNGKDQAIAGLSTSGTGGSNVVFNTAAGLSRLTINNAANYTYNGQMASNILVIKSGTGVQTLSGTNIYSGGTLISNGVLRFENSYSLPASGTITLASNTAAVAYNVAGGLAGTLFPKIANIASTRGVIALTTNSAADTINFSTYANLFLGAAENVTNSGAYTPFQSVGGTLTNYFNLGGGAAGAILTFTNVITDDYNSGGQSVVNIGGSSAARAVVELTGANTYTGGTFLNGSELSVSSDNNLGAASSTITFGGGVLRVTGATLTNIDSRIVNWDTFNGGFDINDVANTFTITNAIGGSSGFIKLGSGTLALFGANTFGGELAVQRGLLRGEWDAGIPLAANLDLSGGVWETGSGLVANNLGSGSGELQLSGSTGGFSAITTPLTVNLGGAGGTIQWGNTYFNPSVLVLNETTANQPLSFINPIDFGNAIRTIAVNASTATLDGGIINSSSAAGLVKTGAGTLVLNHATAVTTLRARGGTTIIDNAMFTSGMSNVYVGTNAGDSAALIIRGNSQFITSGRFYAGFDAGSTGRVYLTDSAYLQTTNYFYIGNSGMGALYQSNGAIRIGGTVNTAVHLFRMGAVNGGYGYYNLSGGSFTNAQGQSMIGAAAGGVGVIDMTGGSFENSASWIEIGYNSGIGIVNVLGGALNGLVSGILLGNSAGGYGVLTIGGTGVVSATGSSGLSLPYVVTATGIVNLLSGGTLNATIIRSQVAGGTGVFNFAGGTLRATASSATFMQGLQGAYVYSGGATIDTGTNIITVAQSLQAPQGAGVASIGTNGFAPSELSGYIGAPYVRIGGGSGSNATAYAQIDPVSGVLTNIVISNPGVGYLNGDTLTVTLVGGGNTNVTLTNYSFAANASGGLTKNGYGALALTGTNTYSGSTIINAGALLLGDANNSIGAGALVFASPTVAIGPTNILEQSFLDWLAGRVSGVVTGAVLVAANSDSNLVFSGTMTNVFLGGLNSAVYTGGATWADNTLRLGNGPGMFVFGSVIGGTINVVIGPENGNPLSTVLLAASNSFTSTIIVNSGSLTFTNDYNLGDPNNGVMLANGGGLRIMASSMRWSPSRMITLADGGGIISVDAVGSTLLVSNTITGNGSLTKAGMGTLMMLGVNNYSGGTFITNGVFSIANEVNAGGAGKAINVVGGTLQVRDVVMNNLDAMTVNWGTFNGGLDINNNGNRFTITNNITGARLTKSGQGLLVLGGNNSSASLTSLVVQSGPVLITNGASLATLTNQVLASGALWLGSNIITAGQPMTLNGNGALGNDGALRNIGGANTNAGPITLASAARINADSNSTLFLTGAVSNNTFGLTIGGFGSIFVTSNIIGTTGGLTKDGAGTLTLQAKAASTFSNTVVAAGTLVLDYNVGNVVSNLVAPYALTLGTAGFSISTGGTLVVNGPATGAITQSFVGLTIGPGNNAIRAQNNGGSMFVNLDDITRAIGGGMLDLTLPVNGEFTTSLSNNYAGILGLGAPGMSGTNVLVTIGGTDWAMATNFGTGINKITNYVGYITLAGSGTITDGSNQNIKLSSGGTGLYDLGANATINSIVAGDTGGSSITNNGYTLRLGQTGGILLTPTSGGLQIGASVNDGFLTAGGDADTAGEMVFINNSANPLTVNSVITSNGTAAVTVTVNGHGQVNFTASNAYNGITYVNAGNVTFSGTNVIGPVAVQGGTLTFNKDSTNILMGVGGDSIVNGGVLNLDGPTVLGVIGSGLRTNYLIAGTVANSRGVVVIGSNVTARGFQAGTVSGGAGAFYQTGGVVSAIGNTGGDNIRLGNAANAYGYYKMTAGQAVAGEMNVTVNLAGAVGVLEMWDGTMALTNQLIVGRGNAWGVVNIYGGTLAGATRNNANRGMSMSWDAGSRGIVNVLGGTINAASGGVSQVIDMAVSTTASGSVINLSTGGKIIANKVMATGTAVPTYFNFDGGTLQAGTGTTVGATFMQGLTAVTIYKNGAIINSDTKEITIAQNLLAPVGFGLTNIAVANGGIGYIGAPVVAISGGSGTGATAIAQVDLTSGSGSYGQITNILITSRGFGYLSNDAINITLMGGGALQAAQLGAYGFGANSSAGGLTKNGYGALTLLGTNTYGGPTIINAGGLVLADTNTSISANTLTMAGAASSIGLTNVLEQSFFDWLVSRVPGVITGAVLVAANSDSNLVFSGTMTNVFLGGLNSAVYTGGATWDDNTLRLGNGPGMYVFGSAIGADSNVVVGSYGGNPLGVVMLTNVNSQTSTWVNCGTLYVSNDFSLGVAGAKVFISSNGVLRTTNVVTFDNRPVVLNDGGGTFNIDQASVLTNNSQVSGVGALTKAGAGTLVLVTNNTYRGGTLLNAGFLTVSNGNALSSGALTFNNGILAGYGWPSITITQAVNIAGSAYIGIGSNLTFNNTVDLGGAMRLFSVSNGITTLSGLIQNGGLMMGGTGTLVLARVNTYAGGTILTGGFLSVTAGGALGTGAVTTLSTGKRIIVGSGVTLSNQFFINGGNPDSGYGVITGPASGIGTVAGPISVTAGTGSGGHFAGGGGTLWLAGTITGTLSVNFRAGNIVLAGDGSYLTASIGQDTTRLGVADGMATNALLTIAASATGALDLYGYDQSLRGLAAINGFSASVTNSQAAPVTLRLTPDGSFAYTGGVHGLIDVVIDGTGTQIFAGASTYTGPTIISNGTLQIGGVATGSSFGSGVVTNYATLLFNRSAPGTVTNLITGSGVLVQAGSGVVMLTNNNTYTGNTFVRDGILQADFGAGLSANSLLVLTGGTISTFSGTVTNTIGNTAGHIQFVDGVAGGFSAWNAPLTVNMNNDGGTLVFGGANFNPSALILNYTLANDNITFTNGLDLNGASRAIAVNATNMGLTATVSGVITNNGAPGSADLRKIGPGVLVLTANNKFSGGLVVEDGVLRAEWGAGIPTTANLVLTGGVWETASGSITANLGSGAGAMRLPGSTGGFSAVSSPLTVNLDGGWGGTIQWGTAKFNPSVFLLNAASAGASLDVANVLDLNGADRIFAVNSDFAYPVTISGVINNSSGTAGLIKAGAGLLILPDTTINTYNGATIVREGVLRAAWGAGLPNAVNLVLTGGVWETTSGSVTANAGPGAGEIQLPGSTGGFSAVNNPLTVNLSSGATLVWGTNTFNPSVLVLNTATANQPLRFDNWLDFSNAVRTIAVNVNTATLAGAVNAYGSIGLTKTGNGTLLFTNTTPVTWGRTMTVSGGTLSIENGSMVSSNIVVGSGAGSRAVMTFGGNSTLLITNTATCIQIGMVGAAGAFYQTGGVINNSPTAVNGEGVFAPGYGGYGYYRMTDGLLVNNGRFSLGGNQTTSIGVFEQFGGVVTNKEWVIWRQGPAAVMNLFGGEFNANNASGFTLNYDGIGYNVLNIAGATVNLAMTNNLALSLSRQSGATGIVNLLSGTLTVNQITAAAGARSVFNFDGGTLKANSNTTFGATFMTGLAGAYIYDGGAIINTDTSIITFVTGLQAPTGSGLSSLITNGLPVNAISNYIGTPAVVIAGGSGTGATAIAQFDLATGILTNIFVTSAGSGYGAGDLLTITLMGGGNTNVTLTNYSFALNTSGGLTKSGLGKLILAGTNTYTGPTVINAGSIQVGNGGASGTLDNGLIFGAYTFTNSGSLIYNRTDTNTAGNNVTGAGGKLVVLGSGSGQLNLAGTNDFSGGMAVTNGLLMFTHFGALPAAGNIVLDSGVVGLNTNDLTTYLFPRLAASPTGYIALHLTNASDTIDFSGYSGLGLASAENVTYNGVFTPYVADGTNNWCFAAVTGTTLTFTNVIGDGLNASPLRIGSNTLPGMLGVVALRPQQPNTYSGGTFLHGSALNITNDNALGILPGSPVTNITFQSIASLQFGTGMSWEVNRAISIAGGTGTFDTLANTVVIPSTIGGDGAMNKIGSGTLILDSNTNTVRLLTINAGTTILSNMLFAATGMNANGVVIVGDTVNDTNATLVVDTGSVVVHPAGTNNAFTVGNYGSGNSLIVTNGGVIYAGTTNYPGFWLGSQAISSNNTAIVIGANSLIASAGRVLVGDDGSWNTLKILDGGTVSNANYFEVGRVGTASNNLLLVSGGDALATNSGSGILIGESGSGNSLIVTNGGRVATASRFVLGYGSTASNNSAYIGGLGSVLSAASHIQVGTGGTYNLMVIGNNASVTGAAVFVVGAGGTADDNTAIITDAGTVVSVASELRVGELGSRNDVMILTGATVNVASYVQLGRQAGANDNLLLVSGESAWLNNTANGFIVGNAGMGNVSIFTNKARVNGVRLALGWVAGANNNATYVGGTGTLLQVGAGGIWVGTNGSYNSLVIGNGATVSNASTTFYIGYTVGATGNSVLVTGSNTFVSSTNMQSLAVGYSGSSNSFTISDGAVVLSGTGANTRIWLGQAGISHDNQMIITDPGSVLSSRVALVVGESGYNNSLIITNGGWVVAAGVTTYVGGGPLSSNNTLVVSGSGSIFSGTTLLAGDRASSNAVYVTGGGFVKLLGSLQMGNAVSGFYPSNNLFVVRDAGSVVSNAGVLNIGNVGQQNAMVIHAGGVMTNVGAVTVGNAFTATNNMLLVTGNGSRFVGGSTLTVGATGSFNTLTVADGGYVFSTTGYIGYNSNANNNSVLVTGLGSVWSNSGFSVGRYGAFNTLSITSGAKIYSSGTVSLGEMPSSSNNTVVINGAGSLWSNLFLHLGSDGYGNQVIISDGGLLYSSDGGSIGDFGSTNCSILVTGPGSVWSNGAGTEMYIGCEGPCNRMTVSNGGYALTGWSVIGQTGTSTNNAVLVSGAGSVWTCTSNLFVGLGGAGNQLTISDGGLVTSAKAYIGAASSNNVALVTGSGSVWSNIGALYVGDSSSGNQLTIADAGRVFSSTGYVGRNASASNNSVLVTGAGSLWSNSSDLMIGLAGVGNRLIITNGGAVRTLGNFTLGANAMLVNIADGTLYTGGNFDNLATNFAQNNFSGTFIFNGGTARTQLVEMASMLKDVADMATTNFFFSVFQIGDSVSGSNAFVRLVDNRGNTVGAGNEILAASNLIVATAGSTLDLNGKGVFANNLYNTGTIQQIAAGVSRLDLVNTFTNLGTVFVAGGALQFSNAFINGPTGLIGLNGGTLTNFATGGTLTNFGRIGGVGDLWPVIGNEPSLSGGIAATGGVLRLMGGFTNSGTGPVNAGLLAALGGSAHLQVAQSFTNAGSIWLNNATAAFSVTDTASNLVNAAAATIRGQGTINAFLDNAGTVSNGTGGWLTFSLALNNQAGGSVSAYGGSTIAFNGVVTNNGTITVQSQSTLRFNAGLTNNGTLAFGPTVNPSTAIITGTLLVGPSGVISMGSLTNNALVIRGDYINGSTLTNQFNMRNSTVVFGGTTPFGAGALTNTFEVASTNKGAIFAGFDRNMAVGTLNITNHIEFVNLMDNGGGGVGTNECLYVDVLHLFSGATLKLFSLTIYVGQQFIYEDGVVSKTLTGAPGDAINAGNRDSLGLVNVFFDSTGQIVFVPEPSTFVLVGIGLTMLGTLRRRRKG